MGGEWLCLVSYWVLCQSNSCAFQESIAGRNHLKRRKMSRSGYGSWDRIQTNRFSSEASPCCGLSWSIQTAIYPPRFRPVEGRGLTFALFVLRRFLCPESCRIYGVTPVCRPRCPRNRRVGFRELFQKRSTLSHKYLSSAWHESI